MITLTQISPTDWCFVHETGIHLGNAQHYPNYGWNFAFAHAFNCAAPDLRELAALLDDLPHL